MALVITLAGSDCGSDLGGPNLNIEVTVNVTENGDGSGTVTSSDISSSTGVTNLECGPTVLDTGADCSIDFQDAGGAGTLTLTGTPEPGSEHTGWDGACTPASGVPSDCSVSADDGTVSLQFGSNNDVTFDVTVSFELAPPLPIDQIVFESERDGNAEIYVINTDGTGLTRITDDPADDRDPVWSPDKTRIAFVSDRDGNDEIYSMLADGTDQVRLTNLAGSDRRPAYSPDGTRIAFDNDGDGDDEVFVMNVDGTGVTQLTTNSVNFDQGPVWSPSSAQILFTTFRDGIDNLYVMSADGMGQTLLVNTGEHDWQPDWSPDGTRIVFTQQHTSTGNDEIFVVNSDGSTALRQLTMDAAEDREATWSPDGNWIAFTSERGGNRDIYVMRANGRNVTRVTTDPADDSRPSWVH